MLITPDMPTLGYKCQLAKRFDRASHSYDSYAEFQKLVLKRLLAMLPSNSADIVLDLGSGTGQALSALTKSLCPVSCIALDLSPRMLTVARERFSLLHNTHYVCADAEFLPLQSSSCDLVFSSLAIQWCLSPSDLFKELYRVTKPGGHVVFSTLSKGSMPEISQAWLGVDDCSHTHQYMSEDGLLACVAEAQWNLLSSQLSNIAMWFDSPASAIDSLKKVGASFIAPDGSKAISPSVWKAFLHEYEKQRNDFGIPLSYQVSFVVAQKPSCV
jgi:malonyl-CoA O-methyltransferase